jgi:hypothetical protein
MNRLRKGYRAPIVATLRDGAKITVDPSDYDGRILYLFGANDIKVSMNANAFLRSGDVFLDIGANYSAIGLSAPMPSGRPASSISSSRRDGWPIVLRRPSALAPTRTFSYIE